MERLERSILNSVGGRDAFAERFGHLIRDAIDEVIDTSHSGRYTISELEQPEKTYLGTKIEIRLRGLLGVPKGSVLDLLVDGVEVDVKNTIGRGWMIPPEAINHPCLLTGLDEGKAVCRVGLIVIREGVLTAGKNRDQKRGISKSGRSGVRWLLREADYPRNLWQFLDQGTRDAITSPSSGTKRVAALFRMVQERPISRRVVEALAQQDDALKRLRKNGGARDPLSQEGIAILWGGKDRELIRRLGLPACKPDEFVSFRPSDPEIVASLRRAGKL